MSTRPRNPRYFPNMKVRGARRHRLAPFQRVSGAFERLASSWNASAEKIGQLAEALIAADENERAFIDEAAVELVIDPKETN